MRGVNTVACGEYSNVYIHVPPWQGVFEREGAPSLKQPLVLKRRTETLLRYKASRGLTTVMSADHQGDDHGDHHRETLNAVALTSGIDGEEGG